MLLYASFAAAGQYSVDFMDVSSGRGTSESSTYSMDIIVSTSEPIGNMESSNYVITDFIDDDVNASVVLWMTY